MKGTLSVTSRMAHSGDRYSAEGPWNCVKIISIGVYFQIIKTRYTLLIDV